RNEIWRIYRNEAGYLRVDLYYFKDIQAGLKFWGKGDDKDAFTSITLDDLELKEGCGLTYHWVPEYNLFSGINPHGKCAVGAGYILQHLELSRDESGTLIRKDWHWFFDENGEAKGGTGFKLGIHGAYVHQYSDN
ncbi:MAG: CpcT/CpeT family chromophore lyase, partial [Pseudomonadota bacterium]